MNTLMRAGALGAVAGSRSMLAPAFVSHVRRSASAAPLLLMAAGELVADKTPLVPSRTEPLPLLGRMVSGGLVGAIIARERRVAGAMAGAIAAAAAALLLSRARRACTEHGVPNAIAGVCEDIVAVTLGSSTLGAGD